MHAIHIPILSYRFVSMMEGSNWSLMSPQNYTNFHTVIMQGQNCALSEWSNNVCRFRDVRCCYTWFESIAEWNQRRCLHTINARNAFSMYLSKDFCQVGGSACMLIVCTSGIPYTFIQRAIPWLKLPCGETWRLDSVQWKSVEREK
jgi:hypothetical protein